MKNKRNILVVAITRMGDLLQASPSLCALKAAYPESHITVLTEKGFVDICKGIPNIDEIVQLDMAKVCHLIELGSDSMIEAYEILDELLEKLKSKNFDYCLNVSSSAYTALILKILNISESRGWMADEEGFRLITDPWAMLFASIVYYTNRLYNSINIVDIFRAQAGVPPATRSLQYRVDSSEKENLLEVLKSNGYREGQRLICVQAGASQEKRQYSVAKFAAIADKLVEQEDAFVVLTGSLGEIAISKSILGQVKHTEAVLSLVGQTKLAQLGVLLSLADVLITGDTGPMHLSVAVGTPVVALFLASANCFETGPYSEGNIIIQPTIECFPCNPNYICTNTVCHNQVSVELVVEMVKLRLHNNTADVLALPINSIQTEQVDVFVSYFDERGFLAFRQISRPYFTVSDSCRRSYELNLREVFSSEYRQLWQEELEVGSVGFSQNKNFTQPNFSVSSAKLASSEAVKFTELLSLCERAIDGVEYLIRLIADVKSPPKELGKTASFLSECDRNIEDFGYANPGFGIVTRMFIMGKENLRGADAMDLASGTKELYVLLKKRITRLRELCCLE